jgi:hypothetical protein
MAILTISHFLYLTRDQRYKIHAGEVVETVGISVPVWFLKGNTSEPARELFCKYKITNEPVNKAISTVEEGFVINLPHKIELKPEDKVDDSFREAMKNLPTSERLLDIKDKGAGYLHFKQYNQVAIDSIEFSVIHIVELQNEDFLSNSFNVL